MEQWAVTKWWLPFVFHVGLIMSVELYFEKVKR